MDRREQQFAAAKRVSPLVLGRSSRGSTVASDAIALDDHADELIYLEDDQLAILDAQNVCNIRAHLDAADFTGPVSPQAGLGASIDLAGYPDFLSKEMAEQPAALRRLVLEGQEEIESLAAAIQQRGIAHSWPGAAPPGTRHWPAPISSTRYAVAL